MKIFFRASVLVQANPPVYYEGFKAQLRCKLFDYIICYFINVFFNSPNFVLETPICPVISDGARFISYVSCFRTLSRLFSALHGTGHCVIFPLSQLLETFDLVGSSFCHSGYLLGEGGETLV